MLWVFLLSSLPALMLMAHILLPATSIQPTTASSQKSVVWRPIHGCKRQNSRWSHVAILLPSTSAKWERATSMRLLRLSQVAARPRRPSPAPQRKPSSIDEEVAYHRYTAALIRSYAG